MMTYDNTVINEPATKAEIEVMSETGSVSATKVLLSAQTHRNKEKRRNHKQAPVRRILVSCTHAERSTR